jgi:hypothetical protein
MTQLTGQMVRECRTRWAAGEMQKTLCAEFGISKAQMSRLINGKRWAQFPGDRLCPECGKGGLEPSRDNTRTMHVACAAARKSRHLHRQAPGVYARELAQQQARRDQQKTERYATDPGYRQHMDARQLYSMRDRPYLEALRWRVLWSNYRLREVDFLRLLAWQRETCPCGEPFDSQPYVDHDYACCPSPFRRGEKRHDGQRRGTCGKCIRGLLHRRCNLLLGVIEAHPDVIQPIGWVEKYLATPPYQEMSRSA